jgi:hypothetical protein
MKAFFTTLFVFSLFIGLTQAQTLQKSKAVAIGISLKNTASYVKTDFAQLPSRENSLVEVTGEVVAIDIRQQFINLYDAHTRSLLRVSLTALPKRQRHSLLFTPIHFASVRGQLQNRQGKLLLVAHKVSLQTEVAAE